LLETVSKPQKKQDFSKKQKQAICGIITNGFISNQIFFK